MRILAFSFVPGIGYAQAGSTLVGQHLGAGDPDGAARSGWRATGGAVLVMGSVGLLIILTAPWIAQIFGAAGQNTVDLTVIFIYILGAVQPLMAMEFALGGSLRGAGDTRFPLFVILTGLFGVRLVSAHIVAGVFGGGGGGGLVLPARRLRRQGHHALPTLRLGSLEASPRLAARRVFQGRSGSGVAGDEVGEVAEEVGLGEHAHQLLAPQHRQAADLVVGHDPRRLFHGGVGIDDHGRRGHHLGDVDRLEKGAALLAARIQARERGAQQIALGDHAHQTASAHHGHVPHAAQRHDILDGREPVADTDGDDLLLHDVVYQDRIHPPESTPMTDRKGSKDSSREKRRAPSSASTQDERAALLPELFRRAFTLGLSGIFTTEEAFRRALGDTVPRDWVDFAVDQSDRTRSDFTSKMAEEMARVIESMDLEAVLRSVLADHRVELKAEIQLVPREKEQSSRKSGKSGAAAKVSIVRGGGGK